MKEFVEKLIGRLENRIKYNELCHKEFPNAKMSLTYEVQINAYKNAIEIVNQLAEEYKGKLISADEVGYMLDCIEMRGDETWMDYYRKALEGLCELRGKDTNVTTNNDWIPCSERLPQKDMWCLATFENGNVDKIQYLVSNNWGWNGEMGDNRVVTWQPLLEPYQKGE